MVFTKLLLENALDIQPCNYGGASESLLPKYARCIPVLSSRCKEKCADRVLKRSVYDCGGFGVYVGGGKKIIARCQEWV